MYRGTTPTFKLTFGDKLQISDINNIEVTFKTATKEITKGYDDMVFEEDYVLCTLSQEDTLALSTGRADVQARIVKTDGTVVATKVANVNVNKILKEGAIDERE